MGKRSSSSSSSSTAVGDRSLVKASLSANNNRTIRSSAGVRLTIASSASSSPTGPVVAYGSSSPANGSASFVSAGHWWKLDEENISSPTSAVASWESSLKSDLIDFKSLFRVKWLFNWQIVKRYSIRPVIGNMHLSRISHVHVCAGVNEFRIGPRFLLQP